MRNSDTSMDLPGSGFPDTDWSRIAGRPQEQTDDRTERLQQLFSLYWRPIYVYLRRRWRLTNDEAKDRVQEFFLRVLDGDFLDRFEPERGRFRTFVRTALDHFISNAQRDERRLRRGGGRPVLSLDVDDGLVERIAAPDGEDAGRAFDLEWARTLLTTAASRVEQMLTAQGKQRYLELYRAHEDEPVPTYAELAAKFGVSEFDVTNYLHAVRRALRKEIFKLVRATVTDDDTFQRELADVLDEPALP